MKRFSPKTLLSNRPKNRDIVTLSDLGGYVAEGQDVTLYEVKVNLAQQGDGRCWELSALSVPTRNEPGSFW